MAKPRCASGLSDAAASAVLVGAGVGAKLNGSINDSGGTMREEWTPAVERARHAAVDWAKRLGHPVTSLAALALALLDEEEGHAGQILGRAGLSLNVVRTRLTSLPAE